MEIEPSVPVDGKRSASQAETEMNPKSFAQLKRRPGLMSRGANVCLRLVCEAVACN